MATQQQIDALQTHLQTALGVFQEHGIAQALREEAEQKVIAAEAQRISTVPLPTLTAGQWAELKAYLVDDRMACPWLIRKFIDPDAEFVFLPDDPDWSRADGTCSTCRTRNSHHGACVSFDAILDKYQLNDPLYAFWLESFEQPIHGRPMHTPPERACLDRSWIRLYGTHGQ